MKLSAAQLYTPIAGVGGSAGHQEEYCRQYFMKEHKLFLLNVSNTLFHLPAGTAGAAALQNRSFGYNNSKSGYMGVCFAAQLCSIKKAIAT